MSNCCLKTVPHSDSSFETLAGPVADWTARLMAGLSRSVRASDQTLGHLEEEILHQTRGLECQLLEEAAQKKADQTPPSLSGLRSPPEPPHGGSPTHLPDPLRAGDDSAVTGVVSALPGLAFSGRTTPWD